MLPYWTPHVLNWVSDEILDDIKMLKITPLRDIQNRNGQTRERESSLVLKLCKWKQMTWASPFSYVGSLLV
jgi:hypothetical protein